MGKKAAHGGSREGAGRKPAVEGIARDQVFSIRLTFEEKQLLDATEARQWARDTLLSAARKRKK